MSLPTDAQERKDTPMCTGFVDYFYLAMAEVARVSKAGNDQHNPGQPLHWAKEKSTDHADCIMRHLSERGKFDTDNMRHSAKMAWRSMALLQIELEEALKQSAQPTNLDDYYQGIGLEWEVTDEMLADYRTYVDSQGNYSWKQPFLV